MAVKEKGNESSTEPEIEWNVENEIQLFFAMNGHKPVGVNKYFHMVCIWEKFRTAIRKDISLKTIWDHLESMYDLIALDEMEDLPFPSNESEFSLPDQEFTETMRFRKKEEPESKAKEQREKHKDIRKEKDIKETPKKEIALREVKGGKDIERKKEEAKKSVKEVDVKKDKLKESKDERKEQKLSKSRSKGKDVVEETANGKKERKDSESSRESLKRAPKRPTRQSVDSSSKATSSPCNTPPPKRRRI